MVFYTLSKSSIRSDTYPERVAERVVFAIVYHQGCSFTQLNQGTNVLRHLNSTRTDLKLVANLQIFLCFCRKELIWLQHFYNSLSLYCAVSKHNLLVYFYIRLQLSIQGEYLLTPLTSALIFKLVYWQSIVELMSYKKHRRYLGYLWLRFDMTRL